MEWVAVLSNGEEISRKDAYKPESMTPQRKILKYALEKGYTISNFKLKGSIEFELYSGDIQPERLWVEETDDFSFNTGLGDGKIDDSYWIFSYCVNDVRFFLKIHKDTEKITTFFKTGVEDKYKGIYGQNN